MVTFKEAAENLTKNIKNLGGVTFEQACNNLAINMKAITSTPPQPINEEDATNISVEMFRQTKMYKDLKTEIDNHIKYFTPTPPPSPSKPAEK